MYSRDLEDAPVNAPAKAHAKIGMTEIVQQTYDNLMKAAAILNELIGMLFGINDDQLPRQNIDSFLANLTATEDLSKYLVNQTCAIMERFRVA